MKPSSIGIGFSHQRQPSLSKTAMRSTGGTKLALPTSVTRATKSTIADFAGPSFQEGRSTAINALRRSETNCDAAAGFELIGVLRVRHLPAAIEGIAPDAGRIALDV